jgi:hypothetical protein
VDSVSVVKCLPIDFNETLESKFSTLVPMETHEMSSLYRYYKANITYKN